MHVSVLWILLLPVNNNSRFGLRGFISAVILKQPTPLKSLPSNLIKGLDYLSVSSFLSFYFSARIYILFTWLFYNLQVRIRFYVLTTASVDLEVVKSDSIWKIRLNLNLIRPNFFKKSNWSESDPIWSETARDNLRLKCPRPNPTRPDPNPNDPKLEITQDLTTRNTTGPELERPETRDNPKLDDLKIWPNPNPNDPKLEMTRDQLTRNLTRLDFKRFKYNWTTIINCIVYLFNAQIILILLLLLCILIK
jgi:hypothetical protein